MPKDIVLVCGFGRCGSSLIMQMLYYGGLRFDSVVWPACEETRTVLGPPFDWLEAYRGSAVKWLSPDWWQPPMGWPFRSIWLDRNANEQAKSTLKWLRKYKSKVYANRPAQIKRGRKQRREIALKVLRRRGPVLLLRYEDLKLRPERAAQKIAVFTGHKLDVEAMARAVKNRETKCLDGMLEPHLDGPPE